MPPSGDPQWTDDLMGAHDDVVNDCDACHSGSGRKVVSLSSSDSLTFPMSCIGCHGRTEDGAAEPGAGLREHHNQAVAFDCTTGCHTDVVPVGEDVLPPNYGTLSIDPCNPGPAFSENFPANPDGIALGGLDNDGDLLYDGEDPDCAACGNGIVDPGEDCDDGNTLDGDCCSATCQFEAADSPCPDGMYCNGDETCDGAGTCQAGTPVDCSDGVDCTDDSCDEVNDVCVNDPNDLNCTDDGLFCTGDAFCDAVAVMDCSFTGDPCDVGSICNEATDTCDRVPGCGDGIVDPGEDCDDGNTLDGDCCSATCQFEAADSPCPDGMYCNGDETCDGAGTCQAGTPVDCSDGVGCTVDSCDEATDSCDNTPDDDLCDNGVFCDGTDVCDSVNDCQPGTAVDCDDGVGCTDDSCDEDNDVCVNDPNDLNCTDDGLFCTGDAFCDAVMDCSAAGDPCDAGTVCNEETDTCDTGGGGGGCELRPPGSGRSGMSNATSPILILLCLCALLIRKRRRNRRPATGR
jgi:cysteine-rich repeat protein